MEMGIAGKRALVTASSKGLGRGCAAALAAEGVNLVLNARGADALELAADGIRLDYGVEVVTVPADITTEAGQAAVLEKAGEPDILVTNAGGPPPGLWSDWDRGDFIAALDANLLAPIALMQACLPAMMAQGWGRVVNITSMAVKSPSPVLGLSNTARTGLTGFVAGTARQVAGAGVTINNLLPGYHATDRIVALDQNAAERQGVDVAQVQADRFDEIPAGRYGTAEEFGAACAFLCSVHAGYFVGQNILVDGGAIRATF
ncbi:MAG: SDR family oxidoreductase [Pseudomonadota bacterium]